MRIPGIKWLRRHTRWLRSRLTGGVLILGYHRIVQTENDYYEMCVSPEHFEQQLSILRDMTNPIRLDQLVESKSTWSLPSRSVVITFDDGYIDNLRTARPLLAQYQIPATLFVATGSLGRSFWWDELAYLMLESEDIPPTLDLNINGHTYQWEVSIQSNSRKQLFEEIYQLILPIDAKSRQELLCQLYKWANLKPYPDEDFNSRCMVEREISQMAKDDLITVGAHSVTHPRLTDLSTESQQLEIEQSKNCLEQITGQQIKYFSYPHGSFDETTKMILRQSGFTAACASYNDIAHPGKDPFILPRFWVPDWDGDKFAHWLKHWLAI